MDWNTIEFKNPKWCGPLNGISNCRMIVNLKLYDDWFDYCLDPSDPYAIFDAKKLFDKIVETSSYIEPYIPPTEEELLLIKRKDMSMPKLEFKKKLVDLNLYLEANSFVNNSTDLKIQLEWNESITYKRLDAIILFLQTALNLTDNQLDDIFSVL